MMRKDVKNCNFPTYLYPFSMRNIMKLDFVGIFFTIYMCWCVNIYMQCLQREIERDTCIFKKNVRTFMICQPNEYIVS